MKIDGNTAKVSVTSVSGSAVKNFKYTGPIVKKLPVTPLEPAKPTKAVLSADIDNLIKMNPDGTIDGHLNLPSQLDDSITPMYHLPPLPTGQDYAFKSMGKGNIHQMMYDSETAQDKAWNRMEIFAEHAQKHGQVLTDQEMANLLSEDRNILARSDFGEKSQIESFRGGYNIAMEDVAGFYTKAEKDNIRLNDHEIALRDDLVRRGLLVKNSGGYTAPKKGYLISSSTLEVKNVVSHEVGHALYHEDAQYRKEVQQVWSELAKSDPQAQEVFKRLLRYCNYSDKVELDEFAQYISDPHAFFAMMRRVKNSRFPHSDYSVHPSGKRRQEAQAINNAIGKFHGVMTGPWKINDQFIKILRSIGPRLNRSMRDAADRTGINIMPGSDGSYNGDSTYDFDGGVGMMSTFFGFETRKNLIYEDILSVLQGLRQTDNIDPLELKMAINDLNKIIIQHGRLSKITLQMKYAGGRKTTVSMEYTGEHSAGVTVSTESRIGAQIFNKSPVSTGDYGKVIADALSLEHSDQGDFMVPFDVTMGGQRFKIKIKFSTTEDNNKSVTITSQGDIADQSNNPTGLGGGKTYSDAFKRAWQKFLDDCGDKLLSADAKTVMEFNDLMDAAKAAIGKSNKHGLRMLRKVNIGGEQHTIFIIHEQHENYQDVRMGIVENYTGELDNPTGEEWEVIDDLGVRAKGPTVDSAFKKAEIKLRKKIGEKGLVAPEPENPSNPAGLGAGIIVPVAGKRRRGKSDGRGETATGGVNLSENMLTIGEEKGVRAQDNKTMPQSELKNLVGFTPLIVSFERFKKSNR